MPETWTGAGCVTRPGAGGPPLAYVAAVVDEPENVAAVFERDLGLPRAEVSAPGGAVPWIAVGKSAIALFEPGHALTGGAARRGVHHLAVAVADPTATAARCGFTHVPATPGLDGSRLVALAPHDTCSIETRLSEPVGLGAGDGVSDHVERIDHIGVACEDNRAAGAVFAGRLGCPVESTQTDFEISQPIESFTSDKYGVVYHSRPPEPVGGLRVSFLTVGDCELELLQPLDPRRPDLRHPGRHPGRHPDRRAEGPGRSAPGNTRGDKGAIARSIERRGPGLHHLALKTPDIDATLARFAGAGHRVIDRVGRPGSRRARIGFVHPASLGGLLLHFVERDEL